MWLSSLEQVLKRFLVPILAMVMAVAGVTAFISAAWMLVSGTIALLATPLVWWAFVVRRKNPGNSSGVMAGVIIGGAAQLLYFLPSWIWKYGLNRRALPRDNGWGGLADMAIMLELFFYAAISSTICSLIGLAIIAAERRLHRVRA